MHCSDPFPRPAHSNPCLIFFCCNLNRLSSGPQHGKCYELSCGSNWALLFRYKRVITAIFFRIDPEHFCQCLFLPCWPAQGYCTVGAHRASQEVARRYSDRSQRNDDQTFNQISSRRTPFESSAPQYYGEAVKAEKKGRHSTNHAATICQQKLDPYSECVAYMAS